MPIKDILTAKQIQVQKQKLKRSQKALSSLYVSLLGALLISFMLVSITMSIAVSAAYALNFPKPVGYVNDFAGMLSEQAESSLENSLRSYEKQSKNEIAVVMVEDLQGTSVEDFAVRLFEEWKIGKKGEDNGVLLLVSKKERKLRIEVGYGLEGKLTDAQAYDIIQKIITPYFKQGDFDTGIIKGVNAIISTISGEGIPEQDLPPTENPKLPQPLSWLEKNGWILYFVFFAFFGIFQWFIAVLGRTKSWWLGGAVGAVIGLIIMAFSLLIGVIAIAVLTPLGLLLDYVVSKAYNEHKKHHKKNADDEMIGIPWWAGGHWGPGGGFGGGSDFGGFGGGGSGGGGASGDW